MLGGLNSYAGFMRENRAPHSAGEPVNSAAPLTDEELAMRLMEEEEREHMQRMLAMAGMRIPTDNAIATEEDHAVSMSLDCEVEEQRGEPPHGGEDEADGTEGMSYEQLIAVGELGGYVSKGAKSELLVALPRMRYGSEAFVAAVGRRQGTDEEQCAICRMEFEEAEDEDDVMVLPCGHFYHAGCAEQWLGVNRACPVCFRDIDAPTLTTENTDASPVIVKTTRS